MRRGWLWFMAGAGAAVTGLIACYVALIRFAFGQWERERSPHDDYGRYSTPEQLQARIAFTTERIWHGTYGDRAL